MTKSGQQWINSCCFILKYSWLKREMSFKTCLNKVKTKKISSWREWVDFAVDKAGLQLSWQNLQITGTHCFLVIGLDFYVFLRRWRSNCPYFMLGKVHLWSETSCTRYGSKNWNKLELQVKSLKTQSLKIKIKAIQFWLLFSVKILLISVAISKKVNPSIQIWLLHNKIKLSRQSWAMIVFCIFVCIIWFISCN